jgi:hypothetical protein
MTAEDWDDPHGLLTDEFREAYADADSVSEALERAQEAESSTPKAEMPRCPECLSVRLRPHYPDDPTVFRDPDEYQCLNCDSGVNNPADPFPPSGFSWLDADALADPSDRGFGAALDDLDDDELTELALRLYRPWDDDGPSYRTLAPRFPYSRKWIGDRVRAWKAGELRDLVPEPGPTVDASSDATAVATDGGRRRWEHFGR